MKHLEDLSVGEFINSLSHLSDFIVTEKIDGTELVFGIDEHNRFFTSREIKGGGRYYSAGDWPKLFWTTSFRAAHLALENIKPLIQMILDPGDQVEVEILYGHKPNTVQYATDANHIVFLRPVNNVRNYQKLLDKIKQCHLRGIPVKLTDIPQTNDGRTITLTSQEHNWNISTLDQIELNIQQNKLNNKLNTFKSFLKKKSNLDLTNLEVANLRKNKENKEVVEATREEISQFKLAIKKHLLSELVSLRESQFGPSRQQGGWVEGLVFRHKNDANQQFKLVDKQRFTCENIKNHEKQNTLRQNTWKPFQKELFELCKIKLEDKRKSYLFLEDFSPILDRISIEDRKNLIERIRVTGRKYLKILDIEEQNLINPSNRILEEFYTIRNRINNVLKATQLSTAPEHVLEYILVETNNKEYKKIYSNNCRRIKHEEIDDTLKYISKKIPKLSYQYLKENLIGASPKKKDSGDIDICIDTNLLSAEDLIRNIENFVDNTNIKYSKGLETIHTYLPIEGDVENANVQIDFMLSDNPEWTKFFFNSFPGKSKYKGLYRNLLLRAAISATNQTIYDPVYGLIKRSGYILAPSRGIRYHEKERLKNKHNAYNKTFVSVKTDNNYISNPNEIISMIFPSESIDKSKVNTFENLWLLLKNYKSSEDLELIKQIATDNFKSGGYRLPEEFLDGI